MKNKFLLAFLLLFSSVLSVSAAEEDDEESNVIAAVDTLDPGVAGFLSEEAFGPESQDFVDPRVLRDFIESRNLIECRQKEGRLVIASDVRARWISANEFVNGKKKRGLDSKTAINNYKSEINLFLDYVAPYGWVSTKLRWVNIDGIDGGFPTRVDIDRAFIGYDVYHLGEEDFYIEVGRSNLGYVYESRVEFTSLFDGIHLYYTNCWPSVGTFVIHGGPFIVDSFHNHYGWIIETFIVGWRGTGLSFKYSLIDWHRHASTLDHGNKKDVDKILIRNNPRYRFIVSQMLFGYERNINFLKCKTLFVYGALLANHDAKRTVTSNWKKLNGAWYAGFTLGRLCVACDWSLDINYQSVAAQAIPEFDVAGIGHGNTDKDLFSNSILLGNPANLARGFTNYKGWQFNLLYALTDSLSLRSKAEWSTPRNKSVGGSFFYKSFEMSVIYAF